MKVESLSVRNFRNIEASTFCPDPSVNFLVGANGQGKTSLIEAIGYLSSLRSFRQAHSSTLIRWGTPTSEISCQVSSGVLESGLWKSSLRVCFYQAEAGSNKVQKTAFVNNKAASSSLQYLSQKVGTNSVTFHSVVFNPGDHDLVGGTPSVRRAFLDRALSAEDADYLKALQKYKRILEQRNAALKNEQTINSVKNRDLLAQFTEPLIQYGALIAHKRLQWIHRLSQPLQDAVSRIAPKQLPTRIVYKSEWIPADSGHFTRQGVLPSLELLEQSFRTKIATVEAAERRVGYSLAGPHRDDWVYFLGTQVLEGHGSQGEIRSSLLALKLSEIELFKNKTGHRPLFLLDDFSSELDRERRLFLMDYLLKMDLQTFVTTTEDMSFPGRRFWVSNGTVEEGRYDDRAKSIRND